MTTKGESKSQDNQEWQFLYQYRDSCRFNLHVGFAKIGFVLIHHLEKVPIRLSVVLLLHIMFTKSPHTVSLRVSQLYLPFPRRDTDCHNSFINNRTLKEEDAVSHALNHT